MSALAMSAPEVECCPAWCEHESDFAGLHQAIADGPSPEDGNDLLMHLTQKFGQEDPFIGLVNCFNDTEIFLSPEEAEKVGTALLQLARTARLAARRAA
jgi:hypothetical protein